MLAEEQWFSEDDGSTNEHWKNQKIITTDIKDTTSRDHYERSLSRRQRKTFLSDYHQPEKANTLCDSKQTHTKKAQLWVLPCSNGKDFPTKIIKWWAQIKEFRGMHQKMEALLSSKPLHYVAFQKNRCIIYNNIPELIQNRKNRPRRTRITPYIILHRLQRRN